LTYAGARVSAGKKIGVALAVAVAGLATLPGQTLAAGSGGVGPDVRAEPRATGTVAGSKAKLRGGLAVAPRSAPPKVQRAIAAANRIVANKPYCYGGGHASWESRCYDCSGSVSYALGDRGAGVLEAPLPSGSFMRWGEPGKGRWISIYANGGHMYAVIAGLRLDTSMTDGDGPGWSRVSRDQAGFTIRHPRGL
jgi:hypothetical protein